MDYYLYQIFYIQSANHWKRIIKQIFWYEILMNTFNKMFKILILNDNIITKRKTPLVFPQKTTKEDIKSLETKSHDKETNPLN